MGQTASDEGQKRDEVFAIDHFFLFFFWHKFVSVILRTNSNADVVAKYNS